MKIKTDIQGKAGIEWLADIVLRASGIQARGKVNQILEAVELEKTEKAKS